MVGRVAESASSFTGRGDHVLEAREVDVVVDDAFVVRLVEPALVAVRALDRDLVQRVEQRLPVVSTARCLIAAASRR